MWTEIVSPESVDSRIWPHTAAIAEVLWSQRRNDQDELAKQIALQDLYQRYALNSMVQAWSGSFSIKL